jgi:hypothetical protein
MLQENVPKARIMRFGYRSQWFGGKEIETGAVSVIDIAERLLKELESNRKVKKFRSFNTISNHFLTILIIGF